MLQLVGERRLSLDDRLERWLPGVICGNGTDGRRITVWEILQHTSGIYNYAEDPAIAVGLSAAAGYRQNRFRTYEPEQLVAIALRHRPLFAPGAGWSYPDTNYLIAGMIIHRVTGRNWADEIRRRILRPLGLSHTYT